MLIIPPVVNDGFDLYGHQLAAHLILGARPGGCQWFVKVMAPTHISLLPLHGILLVGAPTGAYRNVCRVVWMCWCHVNNLKLILTLLQEALAVQIQEMSGCEFRNRTKLINFNMVLKLYSQRRHRQWKRETVLKVKKVLHFAESLSWYRRQLQTIGLTVLQNDVWRLPSGEQLLRCNTTFFIPASRQMHRCDRECSALWTNCMQTTLQHWLGQVPMECPKHRYVVADGICLISSWEAKIHAFDV